MLTLLLLVAIAVSAGLCLYGHYRPQRLLFGVAKMATMAFIIVLALYQGAPLPVIAALLLSAAGDAFLIWPQRFFIHGLLSFLLAHIAYASLFWHLAGTLPPCWLALPLGVLALAYGWKLAAGARRLRIPVLAYVAVLTVMVAGGATLALNGQSWLLFKAVVLFALSDAVLGWNKFVRPFHLAQFLILTTYFAAQTLLAVVLV